MDDFGQYPIDIDRKWSLEDLYRFPRAYEQVYFAFEALLPSDEVETEGRIAEAFRAFPWRGGYSAVNFYNQLKYATPIQQRPSVTRIQYASPGVIELYLLLPLAVQIAGAVTAVAGSILACNKVYNTIYSDLRKRKLLSIDVELKKNQLARDDIQLILESSEQLAHILSIGSADTIHQRTREPLISLKILLSVYRRVRLLADYKIKGKADLPDINRLIENGDL